MYSVKFDIKNGRRYYAQSNAKYHLENEDAMLDEIPASADVNKLPYYYYEDSEWVFDNDAYEQAKEQVASAPDGKEEIAMEEIIDAIMELAQSVSDIEDAIIELAEMEAKKDV